MHMTLTFPRRLADLGLIDVGNEIIGAVRRGGDLFSRFVAAGISGSSAAAQSSTVTIG